MSVGVSPRGREMLWGEWQLAAVQFKQCAAGSRAGSGKAWEEKNQLALCLHGDQAFLMVCCKVFLMLVKGTEMGWRFSRRVNRHPVACASQAAATVETFKCLFLGAADTFQEGQSLGCN